MATLLVMQSDFTCRPTTAAGLDVFKAAPAPSSGAPVIAYPVGDAAFPRVNNVGSDVKQIQIALNRFSPLDGGPMTPLIVDGGCGPATRTAIRRFQSKWGLRPVDGIVDINGATIQQLRQGPPPPVTPADQVATHKERILQLIQSARSMVGLATLGLVMPGNPFTAQAGALLDKYFHVRSAADPGNRLFAINAVYADMEAIADALPGSVIVLDKPPQSLRGAIMSVQQGGPFGSNANTLFLYPRSRTLNQDGFSYGFVHELAHFVRTGFDADYISDIEYFHRHPDRYYSLTPDKAFHNGDSYAGFAMAAAGKPDFNVKISGLL